MENENKVTSSSTEMETIYEYSVDTIKSKQNQDPDYVETVSYRGFDFDVYIDDPGQQYYTEWEGETMSFGAYNSLYREDIKFLVDDKLDTIYTFGSREEIKYFGARLKWFQNAGYRDIGLYYRGRLCRVYFSNGCKDITDSALNRLVADSKDILDKLLDKIELW